MATNNFDLSIKKWVEKTKGRVNQVVRKVVFDVDARLITKTPVDTGMAQSNWMLSSGTYSTATTDEHDLTGAIGLKRAADFIANYDFTKGDSVFITNSMPYIGPLENGHSKQAPNGMVKVTVAEFKDIVENAGKLVQ